MSRRACLRQDDVAIHRVSQGCGGGRAKKKEGHGCVDTGDDEVASGARWISVVLNTVVVVLVLNETQRNDRFVCVVAQAER